MKEITTFFKHIKNPFRKLGSSGPKSDWYIALCLSLVGILVALTIDATLFFTLSGEVQDTSGDNIGSIGIKKNDISDAIKSIEKKDASLLPAHIQQDPSM
jgi:hypothetical protein